MAYANRYYSPRLDRALVSRLYHEAKVQGVPMTVLTNRLVTDGLLRLYEGNGTEHCIVAEEPPGSDPVPAE